MKTFYCEAYTKSGNIVAGFYKANDEAVTVKAKIVAKGGQVIDCYEANANKGEDVYLIQSLYSKLKD